MESWYVTLVFSQTRPLLKKSLQQLTSFKCLFSSPPSFFFPFQSAVDVCASAGFDWLVPYHVCYPSVSRDTAMCIVSNSIQHIFYVTDRKWQLIFRTQYEVGFFSVFFFPISFETKAVSNTLMIPLLSCIIFFRLSTLSKYNFVNLYLSTVNTPKSIRLWVL